MDHRFLEVKRENQILLITLSREDQLNALHVAMIRELRDVFESVEKSAKDIRGIVITGKGSKAFAAGADIKELTGLGMEQSRIISRDGHFTFDKIEKFHIPVIAAINGYALGGGFELALACHIRVAGTHARVGLPESSLGLIPGYGGTQRLTSIVGRAKAIELMCSGEMIDAHQAEDLRLVSYVTEPGQEVGKAIEIIEKMTRHTLDSTQYILKASLMNSYPAEDGYVFEQQSFAEILQTPNGKEGMQAFLEKRKPKFRDPGQTSE